VIGGHAIPAGLTGLRRYAAWDKASTENVGFLYFLKQTAKMSFLACPVPLQMLEAAAAA